MLFFIVDAKILIFFDSQILFNPSFPLHSSITYKSTHKTTACIAVPPCLSLKKGCFLSHKPVYSFFYLYLCNPKI